MRLTETDLSGGRVLLLDKPAGWTSFDVVNKIKKTLLHAALEGITAPDERKRIKKKIKVGHAGTLDPLATGLLVVCTGAMTKKISGIQDAEKEYTGTIVFGASTPSYDKESEPDHFYPTDHLNEEDIRQAAASLTGRQEQTPPAYSAIRVDGRRAYQLARKGEAVELKARTIEVHDFTLTGFRLPEVDFRIRCSKGTYIRSLANDLGKRCRSGAFLGSLRRTRIGNYRVEDAVSPDDILKHIADSQ